MLRVGGIGGQENFLALILDDQFVAVAGRGNAFESGVVKKCGSHGYSGRIVSQMYFSTLPGGFRPGISAGGNVSEKRLFGNALFQGKARAGNIPDDHCAKTAFHRYKTGFSA